MEFATLVLGGISMKIISTNREKIVVELNPLELDLIKQGITKESNYRQRVWKQSVPTTPEELMYHAIMKDTASAIKAKLFNAVEKYRQWKILK